ncbi:DUF2283 domain-containing protein [Nocardia sp. BMG51109]|uniref:DUF2283 domain-containing protein n=1 Tax=Nocardia sp. BMG51109 TaxID=1056816 RepID=UPI0004665BE5|nr:DUF2283 domain-containing protein [Nocardia sp. BMG51109]
MADDYVRSVTWDKQANAAYLTFRRDPDHPRRVAYTLPVHDAEGSAVVAALDFATDGSLMGIELLDAETQLGTAMKEQAGTDG